MDGGRAVRVPDQTLAQGCAGTEKEKYREWREGSGPPRGVEYGGTEDPRSAGALAPEQDSRHGPKYGCVLGEPAHAFVGPHLLRVELFVPESVHGDRGKD